jgi:WD40 repeat protein
MVLVEVSTGALQVLSASKMISPAVSADGQTLALVGDDGAVRVWRLPDLSGRPLLGSESGKPPGLAATAALALSPDGHWLARTLQPTGDHPAPPPQAQLCELATGACLALPGYHGETRVLAFSPDGQTLAECGNADGTVHLWDVFTRKERVLQADSRVYTLDFATDSKGLALLTGERLLIWDLPSGVSRTVAQSDDWTRALGQFAYLPDGTVQAGFRSFADGLPGSGPALRDWLSARTPARIGEDGSLTYAPEPAALADAARAGPLGK